MIRDKNQLKMEISATIIKDSKNEWGNRITTFLLVMPRIVLAEFNTHRMISRNSASSRAIPTETMLKNITNFPFKPIRWLREHKGMQGYDYWPEDSPEAIAASTIWNDTRYFTIQQCKSLLECEVSKQFINRLLEPYMWHTVIATSTEWGNFFALRAHEAAEIHIQDLAYKMLNEYNKSIPKLLKAGQWHIPFEEQIDQIEVSNLAARTNSLVTNNTLDIINARISVGICAGISYGRIKDKIDPLDMIDLYQSLVQRPYEGKRGIRSSVDPIHASPTEHQAMAMDAFQHELNPQSGNFKGFTQFRKMLPNENAVDSRVIIK